MAVQLDVEVWVAQVQVGVVVGLFGGVADGVEQPQAGGEVARPQPRVQGVADQPPVGQIGRIDVGL